MLLSLNALTLDVNTKDSIIESLLRSQMRELKQKDYSRKKLEEYLTKETFANPNEPHMKAFIPMGYFDLMVNNYSDLVKLTGFGKRDYCKVTGLKMTTTFSIGETRSFDSYVSVKWILTLFEQYHKCKDGTVIGLWKLFKTKYKNFNPRKVLAEYKIRHGV